MAEPVLHDTSSSLSRNARPWVVTCEAWAQAGPPGHDRQSRSNVARHLAEVFGWTFAGPYDAQAVRGQPLYFVPHDALQADDAAALGIRGPDQLFGGVVPHAFVATKAITHPLVASQAAAPDGWSHRFALRTRDAVLRGYTTFAPADARYAARTLLADRPVRIKCVSGVGGTKQHVARSVREADDAIAAIAAPEFGGAGVTVEEQLAERATYSVGVVDVGGLTIAYSGTQRTTRSAAGHDVYGGSTLDVVRGGFDALLAGSLGADERAAVALARDYDAAAFAAYPGAFASRRNYDVLFGTDGAGRERAGVLEQSWRIGGASAAEVLALHAFRRDPQRTHVRCATVEVHDERCAAPAGAFVHYRGVDARAGGLTKYAIELDDPHA